jgi:large subunit ribosomal protein L9
MEIMLLKDVFKLGLAGDVKRVADGYGRNYLIPQGLATLATPGALKQADRIRASAEIVRARLNKELTAVFDQLNGLQLNFPVRAGETGKLYGSVTNQMISEGILEAKGIEVDRHQIDSEPLKTLGVHTVKARLTVDLIPELTIVVHDEDLSPESAFELDEVAPEEEEAVGVFSDLQAELEAEEAEAIAEAKAEEGEAERAEVIAEADAEEGKIEQVEPIVEAITDEVAESEEVVDQSDAEEEGTLEES